MKALIAFLFLFHILRVACCRFQPELKQLVNKEKRVGEKPDQLKVYSSKRLKAFIPCSIFLRFYNWEFAQGSLHLFLIQGRMMGKAWLFSYIGFQK